MSKRWRIVLLIGGSLLAIAVVVALLVFGKLYLAEKKIGYCFDVALDADRLYVAAGDAGMHMLDASEGALQYIKPYHDRGYYRNLKIAGGRAYVADTERGLVVLDITRDEPLTVWEQGSVKGKGIHIEGDRVYLAAAWDGLYIFDITDPDVPKPLGRFGMLDNAWDVWVHDDVAYVGDCYRGVSAIDVSVPDHPRQVGFVTWSEEDPYAEIVRGEGDVAYVAARHHGLVIIDVSDPAYPAVASRYQPDPRNMAEGLAVREGIVYLTVGNERHRRENGLHIVDTRDPGEPVLIGKVHFRDWVEGVYVAGDYAFVANTWLGVRLLDIRHPDRPVLVDTFDVTDWIVRWLRG
jgi:hypothetical protein